MVLDGKALSKKIKDEIKYKTAELIDIYHDVPSLAIIMVGNVSSSEVYVRNKQKACEYCGIKSVLIRFDENVTEEKLINEVNKLNKDDNIHGIIVQLPLPKHLNEDLIINSVSDEKDVDGFGLYNKGRLFSGMTSLIPATPFGIMKLLNEYNIEIEGKYAVVVGRSNIVGKPIAMLLLEKNATVTITHSKTKDLKNITKTADILVVAIGKTKFITADMVKEGAVIIDVGINRVDGKLYGDVDFDEVSKKASFITPVPGGVGPLTIASLLDNTLKAYIYKHNKLKGDN